MKKERQVEIEKKAEDLFRRINYIDSKEEIDIIGIAKKLGFSIGNAVMNDEDDGFVIVEEGVDNIMGIKTDKLIGVNSNRTLEWKRFIIAHEIAHYMLKQKNETTKELFAHREHRTGKDNEENEADFFAACLLMPKDKFTQKFNELKGKGENDIIISRLAKIFVVTTKMIERRIEELGLDG